MPDYAKLRVGLTYSENSDYSTPRLNAFLDPFTSTTVTHYETQLRTVGTSAETIELGGFTAIQAIVVKNKDTTNYVDVVWTYTDGAAADTTNKTRVVAGGLLVICGTAKVASDMTLTANTAACDCEILILGT